MQITIEGRPVSKKNSRRNFVHKYTHRMVSIPSKGYETFKGIAIPQIKQYMYSQTFEPFASPIHIDYVFYRKGKYKQDVDNAIASINDILQDAGLIVDDDLIESGSFRIIKNCSDWKTTLTITQSAS